MGNMHSSKSAKIKGQVRKRRRKRAEHREATKDIREARNAKMRAEGHPGWMPNQPVHWWDD
jgi:hypothetical protein